MTFKKVDEAVTTLFEMNDELTQIDAMLDECERKNGDAPHRSVCRADRIKVLAGYSGVEPRKTPEYSVERRMMEQIVQRAQHFLVGIRFLVGQEVLDKLKRNNGIGYYDNKFCGIPITVVCKKDFIYLEGRPEDDVQSDAPKLSSEIIGKVTEMVGILTKQKMEYVNHLSVENFTSEVTDEMLKVIAKYV